MATVWTEVMADVPAKTKAVERVKPATVITAVEWASAITIPALTADPDDPQAFLPCQRAAQAGPCLALQSIVRVGGFKAAGKADPDQNLNRLRWRESVVVGACGTVVFTPKVYDNNIVIAAGPSQVDSAGAKFLEIPTDQLSDPTGTNLEFEVVVDGFKDFTNPDFGCVGAIEWKVGTESDIWTEVMQDQ